MLSKTSLSVSLYFSDDVLLTRSVGRGDTEQWFYLHEEIIT